MEESFLEARLNLLRRVQNPDGGWSYFPGKQSWIEPTAWAALALYPDPASDRAWSLLKSWQRRDGSFKPAADVQAPNWATALCVNLATVRGEASDKAIDWLLDSWGVENDFPLHTTAKLRIFDPERNFDLKAWPWKPGESSWVEPTAHSIVALKRARPHVHSRARIGTGEAQLIDVRCPDGGWNFGVPKVLGIDQPSYPETTGIALLALQGRTDIAHSLDLARKWVAETPSPMARAWLTLALRLHGIEPPENQAPVGTDMLITAIEALGAPGGNHALLKTGASA
ncbi:MAG TPA: hypothetical protein VMG40_21805 [Bryobacteraceae bacterium]|nr:hypothetical protein [Bryobacteraceae bacterium]